MGEIIKKFGVIKIANLNVEFELNKPHSKNGLRSIHVQSDQFRIEFDENEFLKLSLNVLAATKKLKKMKKIDE